MNDDDVREILRGRGGRVWRDEEGIEEDQDMSGDGGDGSCDFVNALLFLFCWGGA